METTERLALPLLVPGQAQKELYHNEALEALDLLVAAVVEDLPQDSPPADPPIGSTFLVGDSPAGDWEGHAGHLAGFGSGGWRFAVPIVGTQVFVRSSVTCAVFTAGGWEIGSVRGSRLILDGQQVVGPRAAAIADPAGGASVDAEARSAIGQILITLRQHGLISP